MAGSPRRAKAATSLNLSELSLDLARLDATRREELGERIVAALARNLLTDRASLLILGCECRIEHAYTTGFTVPEGEWNQSLTIVGQVCERRAAWLNFNIREQPELLAPWAQSYKTDSFAVVPLIFDHHVRAVLCLSNLSAQHLTELQNAGEQLALVVEQVKQLCVLLLAECAPEDPEPPATTDELTLIGSLIEKLDRSMDTRNVFAVFSEMLAPYMPVDVLAIIHDKMGDRQRGVVCVQRPLHQSGVREMFNTLSRQWQRRHRHAPFLDYSEALLVGGELVQEEGECPPELALGRYETFPIFIDNDLFALVSLATAEKALGDRRRMRLFGILAHQLLLHIKKGLLLEQNQEMQTVDALTGLYSERHFYQMMEREFDRAARYRVPICMLIVDVDHFKDVNEAYGFETGDMLLKEISRIIMENIRTTDLLSRYSGERFILLLPETHYKNSEIMANRLRRFVENSSFFIPNTNVYVKVTVSIGVASYLEHKPASLAQFIEFADTALYFAKRAGRNQVVGYSSVVNFMLRESGHES